MTFNSLYFIFIFLPLAVFLVWIVPQKAKKTVLLLVSFLFYAWGNPRNLLFLAGSILFNYLTGIQMGMLKEQGREKTLKRVIIAAVAANILLLCLFKYTAAGMPVGISFYTFSVLSYLFDVLQGAAQPQHNLLNFALYVSLFPKVTSGPIAQYRDMEMQLAEIRLNRTQLFRGIQLFLVGLGKKVLLADQLGAAFAMVTEQSSMSVLSAWLGMVLYSLQLYYDFSGYSDMAIGLAGVFGFEIKPNFNYPYLSRSVSEFWRRWHISLGAWFRQYVYIPLGGNRVSDSRLFMNLLIVWLLTGIWHGSGLNFIVWGLWHGLFVILERFVIKDKFDRVPRIFRILVTDLIAFTGWVFFFSPSLPAAVRYLGQMFGAGGAGVADSAGLYYLAQFAVLLVAAGLGSVKVIRWMVTRIFYRNGLHLGESVLNMAAFAGTIILLICITAGLVSNTYQSFLYFQF
ncbi:MAG: MBOAT family protein [Eubacterium sp.]|nr:MBOAT family protein [Eubacterium sp.]